MPRSRVKMIRRSPRGDVDDRAIVEVVAPDRVETDELQVPRERAEMHVYDETRDAQRLRAEPHERRAFDRLEHRINGDALAAAKPVIENDRAAIDEDDIDFGVGDADRLDRILDRRRTLETCTRKPACAARETRNR